ncbi:VOC family protein [Cellulomonas sp. JH27-2]|uniref:VOC family protein n=1 Tax=Cellulomonas sp. JH27-2 TaxID=2774139 RepID=UPI001784CE31|nr:VOC family protein [Cellulomonas sp. JH27-2]MBD8059290.1 VOC family protein [Cellulomonas sp. JH27-2]
MTTHPGPWPPGTPAWADLTVPSLADAHAFYGPLLGWGFDVGGPEVGGYTQATLDGRRVVGIGEGPGDPRWCVYLATDDIAGAAQRVGASGGQVLVGPTAINDAGSMAIAADPAGAPFGLWRAHEHTGWDVVAEPGAMAWVEVMAPDQPTALAFYAAVTGLEAQDMSGDGFVYATLRPGQGHDPVLGVGQAAEDSRAGWTLYLATADTDATAARAVELGGEVVVEPTDSPFGRVAVLQGPFGETFAVIASAW